MDTSEAPSGEVFNILLTYEGSKEVLLTLPKSANVYDLKAAIQQQTKIGPGEQLIEDWAMLTGGPAQLPLEVLGFGEVVPLTVTSSRPQRYSPPPPGPAAQPGLTASGFQMPADLIPPELLQDPANGFVAVNPGTGPAVPPSNSPPPQDNHDVEMADAAPSYRPHSADTTDLTRFSQFLDRTAVETDVWTEQFVARYGDTHPIFIGGPFSEVLKTAKETMRPVVANIHSRAIDCRDFSSLVLTSGPLASFLAEHFMFWVGYIDPSQEEEASKIISHGLRIPLHKEGNNLVVRYPITVVFGFMDGSLSVLELIEGCCTADELVAKLMVVVDNYGPQQEKARLRKAESERQRMLLEEQNQAYAASLAKDAERRREKEETERLVKQKKDQQELDEKNKKETKLKKLSHARAVAVDKLNTLPPEPTEGRSATVAVRLPDGSKLQRKFTADAPLQLVYDFLEGNIASKLEDATFVDDASSFEADEPVPWTIGVYELTSNYPKKRFTIADASKTLQELGLAPGQALLFMQDRGLGKSR